MPLSRLFLPLLFAISLLFAQQGGAAHTLRHTLAGHQQQDKQTPNSHHCEQCALDAQLGSALHSPPITLILPLLSAATWSHSNSCLLQLHTLSASARGPPAPLHQSA